MSESRQQSAPSGSPSGPSPLAMVAAEVRALDVSVPALRKFGLVVGGVFAGIAAFSAWRNGWELKTFAQILGGLGLTLIVLGAVVPVILRPVYKVWMALAFAMGFVMTRVILTLAFFLTITPIGFILRALGKDPLAKRPDPDVDSYWVLRDEPAPSTKERLERYF